MTDNPTLFADVETGEQYDVYSLLDRLTREGGDVLDSWIRDFWAQEQRGGDTELLMESLALDKLLPAFIDAKKEFGTILKEAMNPAFRSRYADLKAVLDAIEPALAEHRLVLMQPTSTDRNGKHVLYTRLMHESGQWIGSRWLLTPTKADPQGEGSALSYARRYQVQSLLSLTSEDDDGAAASRPRDTERQTQRPAAVNWMTEAQLIVNATTNPPEQRRVALLQLMERCDKAHQMTALLRKQFVEAGKKIAAEIAAAEPAAKPAEEKT